MTHRIPHPKRILLFLTVAIAAPDRLCRNRLGGRAGIDRLIRTTTSGSANPDGSHQFRVTWDGSEDFNTSPSQAADGTIAAGHARHRADAAKRRRDPGDRPRP